jgi:hypothetical protein
MAVEMLATALDAEINDVTQAQKTAEHSSN